MQIKYIFFDNQKTEQNVHLDLEFKVPRYKREFTDIQNLHEFSHTTSLSKVTKELPAAYKHPDAAVAAGEDGDAVNEVAAISSLLAVAAEELCAAVEADEEAPGLTKSQSHFQV